MYIETSYPRLNREAARLISPEISNADGNCLSFYFHMHGHNIRQLSVYSQTHSGSRTLLWRKQRRLGNDWHFGSVSLNIPNDSTIKVMYLYRKWKSSIFKALLKWSFHSCTAFWGKRTIKIHMVRSSQFFQAAKKGGRNLQIDCRLACSRRRVRGRRREKWGEKQRGGGVCFFISFVPHFHGIG